VEGTRASEGVRARRNRSTLLEKTFEKTDPLITVTGSTAVLQGGIMQVLRTPPILVVTLGVLLGLELASVRIGFGQNTTGQISGQVTDSTQAALPAATVTVLQVSTGHATTVTTDSNGAYVIPSLQIGTYSVTVEHAGFSKTQTTVLLNVDETYRLNLALSVGAENQAINVTAESATLETTNPEISGTFQTAQIAELPINGRDYGRFSLLTPGAVLRSSQIADITFNGMMSTDNQFAIDGIDATRVDGAYLANGSERGARLLTGSLDTISEFKTLTSNYTADYGRSSGGQINIVTKSGANALHGGLYDYFRNDFFDAKNFFQLPGQPAPKRFNDFGGNLSGPILRDKMFYFANYEGTRQSIGLISGGSILSPAEQATLLVTEPALAPIIQSMPVPGGTYAYVHGVSLTPTSNPAVDTISVAATNRVQENVGSLRLDNTWGAKDSSFVRYNTNYSLVNGPLIGVYPTAFGINDHQGVSSVTTNMAGSETHVFSPGLLNTFLVGLQEYITAFNEAQTLPTISITGLTYSPGNRGLYGREPNDIQYGDSVTWVKGRHTMKFGVGVWDIAEPFHGYISAPSVSFSSLTAFENNQATISATFPNNKTRMIQVGTFATDTWQVTPKLALSTGLRWDWDQVPHDLTPASVWSYPADHLTTLGSPYFGEYYKNFQPRVGFAYSPSTKIVVRGGYGLYAEAFQIGTFYNEITNTTPGTTTLSASNVPGLSFPVTPYLSSATNALPTLGGFQSTPREPTTNQFTLSVGLQLGPKTAATVAYVGNHAFRLQDSNGVNYVNDLVTPAARPFPSYSNITVTSFAAQSNYNSFQLEVKQAISRGLSLTADYAYSHALSEVLDNGVLGGGPQQPFNYAAEYGNASNDVRNNLSYTLLYQLPFGPGKQFLNGNSAFTKDVVGGWSLASLGIFHSGVASTVYISTNNGINSDTSNQRPNIVPGISPVLSRSTHVRTAGNFVPWLNFNAFTEPAAGTYGNSRNGDFYGPSFAQADLSVIKDTSITERVRGQFRAEFFNILNHPNFATPSSGLYGNTTWSPTSAASFGQISNTVGSSIGFGTSRQLQLALKVLF
jgi:hypothetical protein